ncbi:unnamed protein product [Urochloa humidicola]
MATQSSCGICGAQDSWKHSLLECNLARCVWALEQEELTEHLCGIQEMEARAWLATAMESLSSEQMARVAITMWAIWYVRRKAIHEHIFQSPLSTHCFIERFISETLTWGSPSRNNKQREGANVV